MPRPTLLAALLLLAACSGSVETTPGGGTGGAGGAPCAPSCEATIESWTPAGTLLKPRQEHATFIVEAPAGAFLYVAGGQGPDGLIEDVERAAIHDDGSSARSRWSRRCPATPTRRAWRRPGAAWSSRRARTASRSPRPTSNGG